MSPDTSTATSRPERARRWLVFVATTLAVYATLPVGPAVWRGFRGQVGGAERWAALGLGAVVVAWLLWRGRGRMRTWTLGAWLVLAAVLAAYGLGFTSASLTPAEKTHFLYYGLVAWVAHRALSLDLATPVLEVCTVLLVAVVGLGDEAIQYALPRRFFEWKDVALNALSGALAVALIGLFGKESS